MNEGLIPRRYAKALYKTAVGRDCAERVYQLMLNLSAAYAADPELVRTVANPFVTTEDKKKLLVTAAGATDKDATFDDFVRLLEENRRLDMAGAIALAYARYYRLQRDIRVVTVVSAAPLAPDMLARIKDLIGKHLGGAKMEFSTRVNPDLIGGFIINIDNESLDASLERQLKELRQSLLK